MGAPTGPHDDKGPGHCHYRSARQIVAEFQTCCPQLNSPLLQVLMRLHRGKNKRPRLREAAESSARTPWHPPRLIA
ncbi:unnamed protein product [Lota lota]